MTMNQTMERPFQAAGQPEAVPAFEDLSLSDMVSNDRMHHAPDASWHVNVAATEGQQENVPAPNGLLIKHTDAHGEERHTFINHEGARYPMDGETYPVEVAARLLAVRNRRLANDLEFKDPLGLAIPPVLQDAWNTPPPGMEHTYQARHRTKENALLNWVRSTGLGQKVMAWVTNRRTPQPAEAPAAAEQQQAFVPIRVEGDPLPRRGGAAATDTAEAPRTAGHQTDSTLRVPIAPEFVTTPTASPTEAPAPAPESKTSRLTRLARGLGLVEQPAPSPVMTERERLKLAMDEVLFDLGQALQMRHTPTQESLIARNNTPQVIKATLDRYTGEIANGNRGAIRKMDALIRLRATIAK